MRRDRGLFLSDSDRVGYVKGGGCALTSQVAALQKSCLELPVETLVGSRPRWIWVDTMPAADDRLNRRLATSKLG
jgi:hypothetical protein